MKTCNVDTCNSPVFGKGYCRYHQYLRTDTKRQIKVKIDSSYLKACKTVDADPDKKNCVFCDHPIRGQVDHHHTEGREGDNLCDARKLYRAHRQCHTEYHQLSESGLLETLWYKPFLARIKTKLPIVHQREIRRIEKSGITIRGIVCLFLCFNVSIIYSSFVYL